MAVRICWNRSRGTITSAIWKITDRPCRPILAPIFTSWSRSAMSDAAPAKRQQCRSAIGPASPKDRFPPKAAVAESRAPSRRTRPFSDIQAGDRMEGAGRKRSGCFGVCNGNKPTFVHGDCQRQPSTPSGGSATAAATAGFDPKRRWGDHGGNPGARPREVLWTNAPGFQVQSIAARQGSGPRTSNSIKGATVERVY
jgi:hypothetical protein